MAEVDQIEYAFVEERSAFVPVASSIENPLERTRWEHWLGGWENINRANHVRQPSTSRVYLRDDQQGAVVLRQQTGSDSRRDMRVSVLVGSAEDLTGWGAARLAHWPAGRQLTDPDQSGVALIARPDLTAFAGANVVRLQEEVLADALELTSPVAGLGKVVLVSPLAALVAAVLKLRAEFVGQRQLVPVGADEPVAAALVLVLTELLRHIGDGRDWPTYSTFEATYPRVAAKQRDPQVLFMPHCVQPERGLTRPVAYVFLAPGLRPEGHQSYVPDGAAGDGPFEYVARAVVWAYLARRLAGFPRLTDTLLRQPENWAGAVEDWATRAGGPSRSQPVIPQPEPTIPADSRQVAPPGEPHEQRWRRSEAQAGDGPWVPEAFSAPVARPTATEQTRHAEDTLRRAIANLHHGLVEETTHTVDAFVRALRSRQWLTPVERNNVKHFLVRVMPGLDPRAAMAPYEEMTDPGLRRIRPSAVDALARLARPDATTLPTSADVVDCLAGVLELESGNALLFAETRDALLLLVHVPTASEHPDQDSQPEESSSELAGGATAGRVKDVRSFLPSTDSDAPAEQDRLGIGRDVEMLARLVAARSTAPPLSIALLGDWGSGKSTLMLHMRRRVERLAEVSRSFDGESAYAGEVRQVEFNAWHYSDDQVWTGLVERLFHVLAEDVTSDEQLAPPEKVLEVSRRLHRERDEEQSRDERITAELEKIAHSPRATGAFAGVTAPQFVRKVAQASARELWADLRSSRAVLLAVAALVLAGSLFWRFAGPAATQAAATAIVVAGPIVALAVAVGWPSWRAYRKVAAWARDRRDALQAARDKARQRVEELDEELVLVDAAAALAAFFVDRGGPKAYAPYRGLVGQVRDDLDQLVRQLDSARQQWSRTGGRRPLERIVLYVDDLDRCSPRRVVEVLAAVHLLLAFPLFVVVVAVDARWLLRSLRLHQHDMFSASGGPLSVQGISRTDVVAAPRDYLDKIFQIPFALRPMGERARQYLSDLLPEVDEDGIASSEQSDAGPFEAGARDELIIPGGGSGDTALGESSGKGPVPSGESARGSAEVNPPADGRPVPTPAPAPVDLDSDVVADDAAVPPSLRITHAENEFLPLLHRFVPNPRAGKKFVNLYRLLRIGVALQGLPEFVGTPAEGGPHQAAGVLLAVLVGRQEQAPALFRAIAAGPPQLDVIEFLRSDAPASHQAAETAVDDTAWKVLFDLREEVAGTLAEIHERIPVVRPLAAYQRWCPEIERFSFAVPDTARNPAMGT